MGDSDRSTRHKALPVAVYRVCRARWVLLALAPHVAPRVGRRVLFPAGEVVGRGFRVLLELAPRVGTPRGSLRGVPGKWDTLKLLCESLTERRKGFPPSGDARGEWEIAGGVTGIRQVTGAIPCLLSSGVGGREDPPGGMKGGEKCRARKSKRHAGPRVRGRGRRGACLCTAWRNAGAVTGLEQRNALARGLLPLSFFLKAVNLIYAVLMFALSVGSTDR